MRLLIPIVSSLRKNLRLCLPYLCYDSAPGGAFLVPEHTPRAKRPANPLPILWSRQHGLCIKGQAETEGHADEATHLCHP